MSSPDTLVARIQGEFAEMPGLRLTLPQASRLWQMDPTVCRSVLDALVESRIIYRSADGHYISWPSTLRVLKSGARELQRAS